MATVKDNNMMMWGLGAVAAWWLYTRGTLDTYIDPIVEPLQEGFQDLFPGDAVVVNGNGEAVVVSQSGEIVGGNGAAVVQPLPSGFWEGPDAMAIPTRAKSAAS